MGETDSCARSTAKGDLDYLYACMSLRINVSIATPGQQNGGVRLCELPSKLQNRVLDGPHLLYVCVPLLPSPCFPTDERHIYTRYIDRRQKLLG